MKVIILCNSLIGGGAEKVASDTYDVLLKSDMESILIASTDETSDIKLKKSKGKGRIRSLFNCFNFLFFCRAIFRNHPDVIHIHNYVTELTVSVIWAIRFYKFFNKVKVIQTLHDHHLTCPNSSLFNEMTQSRCMSCINSPKTYIIKKRCYRGNKILSIFKYARFFLIRTLAYRFDTIDLFCCPSVFIQNILIDDGIEKNKTIILRNLLKSGFMSEDNIIKNPVSDNKVNILYLGRLVKIKSVETIIDAVHSCLESGFEVSADICGDGELFETFKNKIKERNLTKSIRLHGRLELAQIKSVADKSNVLVLPSIVYENAPLVIYEAVALNLYPIVSGVGGMLEAIETINYGSTFEPGDFLALKREIIKFIETDPVDLQKLQAAKNVIKLICAEDKYRNELLAIYRSDN